MAANVNHVAKLSLSGGHMGWNPKRVSALLHLVDQDLERLKGSSLEAIPTERVDVVHHCVYVNTPTRITNLARSFVSDELVHGTLVFEPRWRRERREAAHIESCGRVALKFVRLYVEQRVLVKTARRIWRKVPSIDIWIEVAPITQESTDSR